MNMIVGILFDTRFNFSEHNKSIIQTTTTTETTKTKKITATGLLGKLHHVLTSSCAFFDHNTQFIC